MSLDPTQLGAAMAAAMPTAWEQLNHGKTWPGADTEDAEVLFRAVAMGLLKYLHDHPNDSLKTITLTLPLFGDQQCIVKNVVIDANVP